MDVLKNIAKVSRALRASTGRFSQRESSRGGFQYLGCSDSRLLVGGCLGEFPCKQRLAVEGKMHCDQFQSYNQHSAGIWVEFATDSKFVDLEVIIDAGIIPDNMSVNAALGIDVYVREGRTFRWMSVHAPKSLSSPYIRTRLSFADSHERHVVRVYMPLYARVRRLHVGVPDTASFFAPDFTADGKPVLFYGSSITQGCAAARPALCVPSLVGRCLNRETINLGFSSSAFGETEIARAIGELDLGGVVIEYDHNADLAHLRDTHETFVKTIRECNTTVPIVLLSRASAGLSCSREEAAERLGVIEKTYRLLVSEGDTHISLLSGDEVIPEDMRDSSFADDRHPNQKGLDLIAEALVTALEGMLHD